MKVSNETKVGALTAIAITAMILGFNFLKGRTLLKTGNFLYAKYNDAKGIMVSNPVYINGYQVGAVFEIENTDADLKNILVTIKLKSTYHIPINSTASVAANPLGTPSIAIALGDASTFLNSGDTLKTINSPGLLGDLSNKVIPVADQLKVTLQTLDNVLKNVNSTFDPNTKNNLQEVIANLSKATASLTVSSNEIEAMLNKQNGSIAQSINNVNSFSKNLSDNNDKITKMIGNVESTTDHLSKADINGTVAELKSAVEKLNITLDKLNSSNGSMGLLLNDKSLYNNLNNTLRSTNTLMDDLRLHPKRYVNISVFGKKDKTGPISAPVADSTNK